MLDKKVFKDKMEQLIRFYPSWNLKIEDSKVMSDWYSKFSSLKESEFNEIVNLHIDKVRFNPTVASLNEFRIDVMKPEIDYSALGERSSMWND